MKDTAASDGGKPHYSAAETRRLHVACSEYRHPSAIGHAQCFGEQEFGSTFAGCEGWISGAQGVP